MAFEDSQGNATSRVAPGDPIVAALTNLTPGQQYDVRVSDATGQEVAYLRLTPTSAGVIPATILAYDLTDGTHTVSVTPVAGAGQNALPRQGTQFTFEVAADARPQRAFIENAQGQASTSFAEGDDVYVRGTGFPASQEVHVYVVTDQTQWVEGDALVDVSGFQPDLGPPALPHGRRSVKPRALAGQPEVVVADPEGALEATRVWSTVTGAQGRAFDVVVDADQNRVYSSGDVATDHVTIGFMVQSDATRQAGRFEAQLACDEYRQYTDYFDVRDDVYVYVNPDTRMELGNDSYVKKYVCLHRTAWPAGTALQDVSGPGSESQWEADTPQSGCTNEGRVLVWPATLTIGEYDVIIDVNRNGVYNPGVDIIDGGLAGQPGFTVGGEQASKKWTVLVYLDADDLTAAGVTDLTEMEQVGSSDQLNIVVQHDDPTGANRYYIRQGSRDTIATLGNVDSGTVGALSRFVATGMNRYPADHYMLILWDHGNGFADSRAVRAVQPRDVVWDEHPSSTVLTVPEVRQALSNFQDIDVLGFDACLMGMVEVAYELRDLCSYVVASQELEPGIGWPYQLVLQRIRDNPDITPQALAQAIPGDYIGTSGADTTLSTTATSQLAGLGNAIDAWAQEMIDNISATREDLRLLIPDVDYYENGRWLPSDYQDYRDLQGFAQAVVDNITAGSVGNRAQAVITALGSAVIAHEESGVHATEPKSHGLTIWLPHERAYFTNHAVKYSDLRMAGDTQWDEFLAALWGVGMRIELTWGQDPDDLDSHLFDAQSPPNHLYYVDKDIDGANLDVDDTTSYGPENVSITQFIDGPRGQYDYAVYRYAGSTPQDAPAIVRVYLAGEAVPELTLQTSGFTETIRWWQCFTIDPTTEQLTVVDQMGTSAPAGVQQSRMPRKSRGR